jgi:4-carboxymuconolactone decarboxylase
LAPLPFEEWSEAAKSVLPQFLRRPELYLSGGAPMPQSLGLFAHHVDLGAAWMTFTELLAGPTARLDPRHRELAILRVAWRAGSEYEWMQHIRIGTHAGLSTKELYAVPEGPMATLWAPLERLILEAVDQIVEAWRISDATWAGLAEHLDSAQLLELSFAIGSYLCFAGVLNSVGMFADPPTEPIDAPRIDGSTDRSTRAGKGP